MFLLRVLPLPLPATLTPPYSDSSSYFSTPHNRHLLSMSSWRALSASRSSVKASMMTPKMMLSITITKNDKSKKALPEVERVPPPRTTPAPDFSRVRRPSEVPRSALKRSRPKLFCGFWKYYSMKIYKTDLIRWIENNFNRINH